MSTLYGEGAGEGRAYGPLLSLEDAHIGKNAPGNVSPIRRLRNARKLAIDATYNAASDAKGEARALLEMQALMLTDDIFWKPILESTGEGHDAASSVRAAFEPAIERLQKEASLSTRALELQEVQERVLALLSGTERTLLGTPPGILRVDSLGVFEANRWLRDPRVLGIACARSGLDHLRVLAEDYAVPVVLGLGPELLSVDAARDWVLDAPSGTLGLTEVPNATTHSERHSGWVVASSLSSIRRAKARGAIGIGLLRSEMLFLNDREEPSFTRQTQVYAAIAAAVGSLPVTFRVFDFAHDKKAPWAGQHGGLELLLADDAGILRRQLQALFAAASGGFSLLFPRVDSALRWEQLIAIAREYAPSSTQMGAMIECADGVRACRDIAERADFLAIGSRDLSVAIPDLEARFSAIREVATVGKEKKKQVRLCGSMVGDTRVRALCDELDVARVCVP